MMGNQYQFEVVRDMVDVLDRMKDGDTVAVAIHRHGNLFDWSSSNGETYNISEIARALKIAYHEALTKGRG